MREADDRTPLVGAKYDPQMLAEGRHPTREDLDQVTTALPVCALHRSMHVAVGNSFLVDGAGLTAERLRLPDPHPAGGRGVHTHRRRAGPAADRALQRRRRRGQLERMAPLGMIDSIFSCHTWFWGDVHLRNFGPERGHRVSPARSALDRGVRVTLHQDTPVTPPDMLLTIWAAVNRISRSGQEISPDQRITTWEALRAVTCEAAYQYREEDSKGHIREGMRADPVILSADPLATPPQDLREIRIVTTIKDRIVVFQA